MTGQRILRVGVLGAASAAFFAAATALAAPRYETPAREAILVEHETGTVLFEKDADVRMPPASMSKLMTLYILFDHLKNGGIKLEDRFQVSENAASTPGSTMHLPAGTSVTVEELIHGIIVSSGNDACVVVAEGLAGSEDLFARQMTDRARAIGLAASSFDNAHGLPSPGQLMTPRDLATLAALLIEEFPEYYPYFAETEFTFWDRDHYNPAPITERNRNLLLLRGGGIDGLKTGHTEEAGYGITASGVRDGRRLIAVVTGLASEAARANEAERLLNWGFREFDTYALFEEGEAVAPVDVWLGDTPTVDALIPKALTLTIPRAARRDMTVTVRYDGPVPAPVGAGERIATLEIRAPEMKPLTIPLVARTDVAELGLFGRLAAAFNYLLWGSSKL